MMRLSAVHLSPLHPAAVGPFRTRPSLGFALIAGLMLLAILSLLTVAALHGATLQERMAGHQHDRLLAFQAAEAALRAAESFLRQQPLPDFGIGLAGLLSHRPLGGDGVFWEGHDWGLDSQHAAAVPGTLAPPRYVIERLPPIDHEPHAEPDDDIPPPRDLYYRITARAVGGTENAVVMLQSIFRIPANCGPEPQPNCELPAAAGGRVSWKQMR